MRRHTDIAVVGAGVIGLAVTDALARLGADVRCFDGRPPGHGQSGGLTRTFRHWHYDQHLVGFAAQSRQRYADWERRVGRPLIGPEGAVYAGMSDVDAQGLTKHDVPHEWVANDQRQGVFGALGDVEGPLLSDPGAGAIRARRTIEALTSWVGDRIECAEVHTVTDPGDGRGIEIQTADEIVRARHVVICAGTATPRLASGVGLDIPLALALHARPHYQVRDTSKPHPCWVDRTEIHGEKVYGSPIGRTGRYVLGLIGDAVDIPLTPAGTLPPRRSMDEHVERVSAYVRRAMPGLDPEPVGVRVCVMSKLPAGSDAFRAWHTPGVTALTGHNLFKMAPLVGDLLAQAALDDAVPEPLARAGEHALVGAAS